SQVDQTALELPELLEQWVRGLELDWRAVYGDIKPPRVSLPAYPFARRRYWVDPAPNQPARTQASGQPPIATGTPTPGGTRVPSGSYQPAESHQPAATRSDVRVLHPLLHQNISVLGQHGYSSTFTGEESFLIEHSGHGYAGRKLLPAVAYL